MVEAIGPYAGGVYRFTVDGYRVPRILGRLAAGTEDTWALVLDERFEITVSREERDRWLWWVAHAMAVSAGYSSFGANSRPANPYRVQVAGLSELPDE